MTAMNRSAIKSVFVTRWSTLLFLLIPYFCHAVQGPYEHGTHEGPYEHGSHEGPYEKEESQIPKKPSAPPPLLQKVPPNYSHCERYFVYQGKKIECDSNLGGDAERLRPLMEDVPAAIAELDAYQDNRQKMKLAAYLGTLGLVVLMSGFILGRSTPAFDPISGTPNLLGYVMIGGLGVTVHSVILGFSVGKTNESHVGNAVQYYNSVHPDQPIELKFSTELNF